MTVRAEPFVDVEISVGGLFGEVEAAAAVEGNAPE
jgi:hypothetical protein